MDRHLALMRISQQVLRFRLIRPRSAGARARAGWPLRRGRLRRPPADTRDRHSHGTRRRRSARRAAARLGRPQAGGRRRTARAGPCLRCRTPARRALFEVDTLDPLTFVGVPLVFAVATLLAAYLPARRARSPCSGPTDGGGRAPRLRSSGTTAAPRSIDRARSPYRHRAAVKRFRPTSAGRTG